MLLLQLDSKPNGRKLQQNPRLSIAGSQNTVLKNNMRQFPPDFGKNRHCQQHPLYTAQLSLCLPGLAGNTSRQRAVQRTALPDCCCSPYRSDCHNPAATPHPQHPRTVPPGTYETSPESSAKGQSPPGTPSCDLSRRLPQNPSRAAHPNPSLASAAPAAGRAGHMERCTGYCIFLGLKGPKPLYTSCQKRWQPFDEGDYKRRKERGKAALEIWLAHYQRRNQPHGQAQDQVFGSKLSAPPVMPHPRRMNTARTLPLRSTSRRSAPSHSRETILGLVGAKSQSPIFVCSQQLLLGSPLQNDPIPPTTYSLTPTFAPSSPSAMTHLIPSDMGPVPVRPPPPLPLNALRNRSSLRSPPKRPRGC